jgi:hypothetical protein
MMAISKRKKREIARPGTGSEIFPLGWILLTKPQALRPFQSQGLTGLMHRPHCASVVLQDAG